MKAEKQRTKTDQIRALRCVCIGPRPIGGLGGVRERYLKNYIHQVAKVLPKRGQP